MSKYSLTILALSFLIFGMAGACSSGKKSNAETKAEEVLPEDVVELRADQIKLAGIQTGVIEKKSLSGTLKVNGIVSAAPQNLATICAPMSGFVKSTTLMPGNAVSKGQVLVVIENQEFVDIQQNYLEARNKLEYAEAEFKRHSELFKEDVYSEKNVQQVTTEYKNLKAQVSALKQKLVLISINPDNLQEDNISRSISLVSPITGYVDAVNVNLGKYVTPTDVMFRIVNNDKLYLELTLFEKDANKVAKDQKIRFYINNESEQHAAIITQTGQSVSSDKTYKVYASVTGVCKSVLPGMYVNAIVETSGDLVTALPSGAVVNFDDKDYIFVFDKNKEEGGKPFTEYKIVEVKKGVTDGGYTEIILPEGFDFVHAKVVVKGAYTLLSAKKNAGEMAC
ncbi:MAG TPA: efflux RND transporter periplasmic adaptor subunit [Prolixibacteraceae bacterium]